MKSALSTNILIVLLSLAVVGLGYNYFFRPIWKRWQAAQPVDEMLIPRQAASDSAQSLKNGLVASLSAQDKIAQLLVVPVSAIVANNSQASRSAVGTASATVPTSVGAQILDPATVTWLQTYKPGFVQLVGMKPSTASATLQPLTLTAAQSLVQSLNTTTAALPWQPIKLVRHASGDAQTLRGTGFTKLPTMAQLCTNPVKYEPVVAQSAAELAQLKISVVIGPVVDLQSAAGFQGSQICADLTQVVPAAQKYIENFGNESIMPVLAHFPGIGQASVNPSRQSQTLAVTVSELKPFQQLLKAYPNLGVLVSPVRVSEKFADKPCILSQECLAAFGKDYPQALVVADIPSAQALSLLAPSSSSAQSSTSPSTLAETIKQSLLAGNHVVLLDSSVTLPELTQALQQLTAEYQKDAAFRQAVEVGWQHVYAVRAGK